MSDSARRDYLDSAYKSAVDAHEAGELEGGHPSHTVVGWSKLAQGRDSLAGNAADPLADADPLTEADPSTPGGNRAGGKTAQDSAAAALEDFAIRQRAGYNMDGELHLARLRRGGTTSASIAAAERAIPGYGRLK